MLPFLLQWINCLIVSWCTQNHNTEKLYNLLILIILQHIYEFLEVGIVWHVLGVIPKSSFVHPKPAWFESLSSYDLFWVLKCDVWVYFDFISLKFCRNKVSTLAEKELKYAVIIYIYKYSLVAFQWIIFIYNIKLITSQVVWYEMYFYDFIDFSCLLYMYVHIL